VSGGVVAVVQARMSSTRLPGKVLRDLGGRPVLGWVVRAAQTATLVDEVVVATSTDPSDDAIEHFCTEHGVRVHRGPLDDVLTRFCGAATATGAGVVVRLTADCPLLDPAVIDATIAARRAADVDYASTVEARSLPRGLDVEVMTRRTLETLDRIAEGVHRVHVTSHVHHEPHDFATVGLVFSPAADDLRVTLDTPDDAAMLDALVDVLGDHPARWQDIIRACSEHPEIPQRNAHVEQKAVADG
jgi:spore coat polysaccharide biosynthesis protein SpsF